MNIKLSHAAFAALVMCVVDMQPLFAQTTKDAGADKAPAKTYKRKLYTGKDADKYRAMTDVQYYDGNRKNRPKGGHEDQNQEAGVPKEERRYSRKEYRENSEAAARAEEDNNARAQRREARPLVKEDERNEKAEREERPTEEAKEKNEQPERAEENRRSYRREMRGSRKEMRRKLRDDKWTKSEGQ
jgi:hypothetical protein